VTVYEVGRYELKYLLPRKRRAEVLELVSSHVRPDDHARPLDGDLVGYTVRTLYLDTPSLSDYFERLERRTLSWTPLRSSPPSCSPWSSVRRSR